MALGLKIANAAIGVRSTYSDPDVQGQQNMKSYVLAMLFKKIKPVENVLFTPNKPFGWHPRPNLASLLGFTFLPYTEKGASSSLIYNHVTATIFISVTPRLKRLGT